MIDEALLKSEEKAVYALRSLYRRYGYLPYKMSKFEEYELYMRNKDFLVSDRIIAFNDTNGKLLALKPDVTLSIIKNGRDVPGCKQKVCYNENVYRISDRTRQYKEIMQAGLECIGDIDLYDIYETVTLAAKSLALISGSFALEISHLGVLSGVLEDACPDKAFASKALGCIAQKNVHDLLRLCSQYDIEPRKSECLAELIRAYGDRQSVMQRLRDTCPESVVPYLDELERLSEMLEQSPCSDKIVYDFSVVNDMNYYNGFVFKGFLDGISEGVLAGGQYDKLMDKMERRSGAIGFALYLDLLEQLERQRPDYDVDVLLLYDAETDKAELLKAVERLISSGRSVSAQKAVPEKLRYRELINMSGGAC